MSFPLAVSCIIWAIFVWLSILNRLRYLQIWHFTVTWKHETAGHSLLVLLFSAGSGLSRAPVVSDLCALWFELCKVVPQGFGWAIKATCFYKWEGFQILFACHYKGYLGNFLTTEALSSTLLKSSNNIILGFYFLCISPRIISDDVTFSME